VNPLHWMRYSGANIMFTVNPLHWRLRPWWRADSDAVDWPLGPDERTWTMGWLFLTIRIWIDDGQW